MTEQEYDNLQAGDIVYYDDDYYRIRHFGVMVKKDGTKIWCRGWMETEKEAIRYNKDPKQILTWMGFKEVFIHRKKTLIQDDPEYREMFV